MDSSPPPVQRIGLFQLVIAVPMLRALGHRDVAADLEAEARRFCDALASLQRSGAAGTVLRTPGLVSTDKLVPALVAAGDVLRPSGDPEGSGSFCVALAALLGALLDSCDPAVTRLLVCVELAGDGTGELVLLPFDPAEGPDLAPLTDLGDQ